MSDILAGNPVGIILIAVSERSFVGGGCGSPRLVYTVNEIKALGKLRFGHIKLLGRVVNDGDAVKLAGIRTDKERHSMLLIDGQEIAGRIGGANFLAPGDKVFPVIGF